MIGLHQGLAGARRGLLRALDFVLPPRCLGCDGAVAAPGALCPQCWSGVSFIAPPFCACCGLPQEFDLGAEALCGACIAEAPPFARARAVLRYDAASRGLLLRFKHADRTDAAPAFARWLQRAGAELLAEAELIVPVPLHWSRLLARRYNQSALLAIALGRLSGRRVVPDLLLRRRRTPSQGGMSATGRRRNVAGAFALRARAQPLVAGKRVLVIDDVLTTGATAVECARVLLRSGAAAVDVLTLARVARP
ncbi:MAG: ComF family protein [Alphaproteobacteria bacterium]|nr:ComF family protein [Alphaproteobacteria bacterium]